MKRNLITCTIIGGGMGGLLTGAFLAKNGINTTVLEKNAIIGGGLQSFTRNGKIFDTGMHVLGGLLPGGNLYKICRYLGILDKIDFEHLDSECTDEIHYLNTGDTFKIPSGKENFVNALSRYFPQEADGIKAYVDKLFELTQELPLYYLRPQTNIFVSHSDDFTIAADKLISRYVSDPISREVLAYINPLYGGMKDTSPAYIHSLINVLYINGTSRLKGGSLQFAEALRDVIVANGGNVIPQKKVESIDVCADHSINSVTCSDGTTYISDYYISDIHPETLLKIMPQNSFRKSYRNRVKNTPNSCSAFSLYVDLKPDSFKYIPHTCYLMEDYGKMWNQHEVNEKDWPAGIMYMTPPDTNQGKYATKLLVHCLMDFKEVTRWADSSSGHRPEEYNIWKKSKADIILKRLEKRHPELKEAISEVYTSSPLTIRDYYATADGSLFGYRKDCLSPLQSFFSVHTKLRNLLLTGQNVNLHGNCGVPLTAILTAEAILGQNFILNKINESDDEI